ncbi:uncharacterized protein LOC143192625 [Rhynchophorus ferrugineus]|uniref:uncharacterized protein LOC143192625 n=1 Tax=Rhynchophorus ferrugineus TaxID=354439 RepID=UPI003FCD4C75
MNFMNTELMDSFLSAFCGAIAVTYGELYDIYLMPLDKMGGFGDIIEFSMITYFFIFSGIFCLVFFIKALMDSHNPLIPAYVTADIFTILSYIFTLYAFGQVTLNRWYSLLNTIMSSVLISGAMFRFCIYIWHTYNRYNN